VNVKTAELPAVRLSMLHEMVPVPPTGGGEQMNVGPLFWTALANVIPIGTVSLRLTNWDVSGPAFRTVIV
jgi:hypothetical protein